MRVFVTGASGGIGSAVVPELIKAGHEVVGLARSSTSADTIAAMGATPLHGSLADLDRLRTGAKEADGVIHLAGIGSFDNLAQGIAEEAGAVKVYGEVMAGTGKALVFAGGTPPAPGRPSTETDPNHTEGPVGGRGLSANAVLALADQGVRSSVVRLPRSVHLRGSAYGFCSVLIAAAQLTGVSGYVGDGTQRWPAVHRFDAARLFHVALEDAEPGSVLHAVGDEGDTMRSLAEAIGGVLGLPTEPVPAERFGVLGQIFARSQPSSSSITQERFGWTPTHPSLLDDLRAGDYPTP